MSYRYLLAALWLVAPLGLWAQVRVELSFDQETYLPEEPMNAIVLIYNNSGQNLRLGRDHQWLSFGIESVDGRIVKQMKPADVVGEFNNAITTLQGADAQAVLDQVQSQLEAAHQASQG